MGQYIILSQKLGWYALNDRLAGAVVDDVADRSSQKMCDKVLLYQQATRWMWSMIIELGNWTNVMLSIEIEDGGWRRCYQIARGEDDVVIIELEDTFKQSEDDADRIGL